MQIVVPSSVYLHVDAVRFEGVCTTQSCTQRDASGSCLRGYPALPTIMPAALPLHGIAFTNHGGSFTGWTYFEPASGPQTSPLGGGVTISNFNVNRIGGLNLGVLSAPSDPGWKSILRGYSLDVNASDETFFSPPFTLTFPYAGINPEQAAMMKATKNGVPITPTLAGGRMSFTLNSFSHFEIQAPIYDTPALAAAPGASLLSGTQGITISAQDPAQVDFKALPSRRNIDAFFIPQESKNS